MFYEVFKGFCHCLSVKVCDFHVSQVDEEVYFSACGSFGEVSDKIVGYFHDYDGVAGNFR